MAKLERTVERRELNVAPLKRASWGAIFGGAFIALAIMTVLGTLGVAVGATTIDPATGDTPSLSSFGIGAGIWWLISGILALFGGGWAAGRLAGLRRRMEGPLHGVTAWALVTVVSLILMTTAVSALMSGAMRIVGAGVSAAGQGAQIVAQRIPVPSSAPDVEWNRVWTEAQQILQQTETPALQPGELTEGAQRALQAGNLEQALRRLYENAQQGIAAADRQAVVNVLTARTSMSEAQAERTVDRWAQRFQSAWQRAGQALGAAGERVQTVAARSAEATADAVAAAAWWTFFYLLLTAAAAGVGGMLGAPRINGRHRRDPARERREAQTVEASSIEAPPVT